MEITGNILATIHQSTTNLSKLDKLSAPEPHKTNQICLVSPDSSLSLSSSKWKFTYGNGKGVNMTQKEQVINCLKELGGYATFSRLNSAINFSTWKTKTPEASIRRIVQDHPEFFRIQPGLWALVESKDDILRKLKIEDNVDGLEQKNMDFSHSYYQGLVTEIGNYKGMCTYVPSQDKNKLFLETPLSEVASTTKIFEFTYENIVKRAKTIDVIWFNERALPHSFYEIEHSTDIQNSLSKFYELQDFAAKFYIIADEYRHEKYKEIINRSIYNAIKTRVNFVNYDSISKQHEIAFRAKETTVI